MLGTHGPGQSAHPRICFEFQSATLFEDCYAQLSTTNPRHRQNGYRSRYETPQILFNNHGIERATIGHPLQTAPIETAMNCLQEQEMKKHMANTMQTATTSRAATARSQRATTHTLRSLSSSTDSSLAVPTPTSTRSFCAD